MKQTDQPRLRLYCYACGKDIADAAFLLVSERDRTDRPFTVHESCRLHLNSEVSTMQVQP